MKITPSDGLDRTLAVFAIYWDNDIRYHLVIPYRDYRGFIVVGSDESSVADSSIDGYFLRKSGSKRDMLVHWSVNDGNLLDRLINPPDEDAVTELERRLREETPPPVRAISI